MPPCMEFYGFRALKDPSIFSSEGRDQLVNPIREMPDRLCSACAGLSLFTFKCYTFIHTYIQAMKPNIRFS
jgi:hypothetical protein